jgi:hypothetical protein
LGTGVILGFELATLSSGFFCVQIQNLLYAFHLISSIEVTHFLGG